MSDPGTAYRTREEIQKVRADNDPITNFKEVLLELKVITEDDAKAMDKAARAEVDKAAEQAKADSQPEMESFWESVYVKGSEPPFLRGREPGELHRYK